MLRQILSFRAICPTALLPVLVGGVGLLVVAGCRSGDTHQPAHTPEAVSGREEQSAKPGINAPYEDPDIDE